jgi:hypothetical protein
LFTKDSQTRIYGNYSLTFTDVYGEDWNTEPIPYDASCLTMIEALESLPNKAVPYGSVRCAKWDNYHTIPSRDEPARVNNPSWRAHGIKYTLAFPQNPGYIPALKVNTYLDGTRPTIFSGEHISTLGAYVYSNGFSGEHVEYFTEKCIGVELSLKEEVKTAVNSAYLYFDQLTSLETRLLQRCLGDADGDPRISSATSTIEGKSFTWDYGSIYNPHLVRLVDISDPSTHATDLCDRFTDYRIANGTQAVTTSSNPSIDGGRSGNKGRACYQTDVAPGFVVPVYYDPGKKRFRLMSNPYSDFSNSNSFAVWTTKGTAQMVSDNSSVYTVPAIEDLYSNTVYTTKTNDGNSNAFYQGNLDCETTMENRNGAFTCLEKEDRVFFLDKERADFTPKYLNLYTAKKLYIQTSNASRWHSLAPVSTRNRIVLDMPINGHFDISNGTTNVRAYKFTPPELGYEYVSECSNRGLCDTGTGLCTCFNSYTGDDCSKLNNFILDQV